MFRIGSWLYQRLASTGKALATAAAAAFSVIGRTAARYLGTPPGGDLPGVFARTWPIGVTALWIAVLLTTYVFIYYL